MSGFAGQLRQRVSIRRGTGTRDPIGADAGGWTTIGEAWAGIAPAGTGPEQAGGARASLPVWRIAMRDRDLAVGDRIIWGAVTMTVRSVTRDPAMPDRLSAIAEEQA